MSAYEGAHAGAADAREVRMAACFAQPGDVKVVDTVREIDMADEAELPCWRSGSSARARRTDAGGARLLGLARRVGDDKRLAGFDALGPAAA
jgi:hypothetical protein